MNMSSLYEREERKISHIANAYYSAEEAAHAGNYEEAFRVLQKAIEPVSAVDQYNWGVVFFHENNYEQAFSWFLKAHEKGYLDATYIIGTMYYNGQFVAVDKQKAFLLLEKVIDEPVTSERCIKRDYLSGAQLLLAAMYSDGEGVEKDLSLSAKWYEKSAENGDIYGRANIGSYYYHGIGVPRSYSIAWEWLKEFDIEKYIYCDFEGDKKVFISKENYGVYSFSNRILGMMYLFGKGVEQDYKKAFTCLLFSGENGDKEAQFWLSVLFELGLGTEKNSQESLNWLEKSASSGFKLALQVKSSCDKGRKLQDLWRMELAEAKRSKDIETIETDPSTVGHQII